MRSLLLAASSIVLVSAAFGCNAKGSAPTPTPLTTVPVPQPASAAPPAVVVFTGRADAIRTVGAVIEDGSAAPVTLSKPDVDTTYAGALPGRRALLAERAADGSITTLVAARVDGSDRAIVGKQHVGQYREVAKLVSDGDAAVVELARASGDASDVFALGAETKMIASDAKIVGVAGGRVAVLAGGNLKSLKLDGTGAIALGAGDGHDQVAEVRGDRILFTVHAGAGGDVRLAGLDGAGTLDLGKTDADETAVGFAGPQRVVLRRQTAAGAVLVSAATNGKDEQVLTTPDLDAKPIQVTAEGQVFFGSAAGAFLAVGATGGAPRVLDPGAGTNVRIGTVANGNVIYTSDAPHWPALRVAKLDGSGVTSLLEEAPSVPFFAGLRPDGRVLYYRSLAGQLEGGRLFSVKLDGTDRRPIGTTVAGVDGQPIQGGPADQDFEAITPSGRVILESEFDANGGGSQLLVGSADSEGARLLSGATHVRFAAVIP